MVCILVQSALNVAPALVIRAVVDDLQHKRTSFGTVGVLVLVGLAALVAAGFLGVLGAYLVVTVSKRVVADVRERLFERILGQSVGYFTSRRGGDLLSRMLNDVGGLDELTGSTVPGLLGSACLMAASLIVMAILSWQLTLITVALFPLVAVVVRLAGRTIWNRRQAVLEQLGDMTSELQELFQPAAMMVVRAFGRWDRQQSRFATINNRLRIAETRAAMSGRWIALMLSNLQFVGPVVLLLVGADLVVHHVITIGTLVSFAAVATVGFGVAVAGPGQRGGVGHRFGADVGAGVRDPRSSTRTLPTGPARPVLPRPGGALRFEEVSFTYPGSRKRALDSVSFEVEPRNAGGVGRPERSWQDHGGQLGNPLLRPDQRPGDDRGDRHPRRRAGFVDRRHRGRLAGHVPLPRQHPGQRPAGPPRGWRR